MDRNVNGEGVRKIWNRYKFVVLIVLVGVVLLLWPKESEHPAAGEEPAPTGGTDLAATQEEMAEILSKISGVGQVQLMLTLESEGEQELAQNAELSYSGSTAAPEDYSRRSETVLVDGGNGDATVVTKRWYPTYRGALVVCQGGDKADVKLAVTQAVSALTGLSADRITVGKWQ
jgi:stage III sporulation protein AG